MTTILYDGRNLHADRAVVLPGYPSTKRTDGVKLFRHPNRMVAFGVANILPTNTKLLAQYNDVCHHILTEMHRGNITDRIADLSSFGKILPGIDKASFMAISRTRAFVLTTNSLFIQGEDPSGLGTGARFAMGAYYVSKCPTEAFRVAAMRDHLTSASFHTILADSLEPFVIG